MKPIISLIILNCLLMIAIGPLGCQTQSPARIAFNVDKTVITTAAAARDAWAAYYVSQRKIQAGDSYALSKLEAKRAQVNAAWFHFTALSTTIVLGQEAGFSNTNGVAASVEAGMAAAAQPFIDLVQSFIK